LGVHLLRLVNDCESLMDFGMHELWSLAEAKTLASGESFSQHLIEAGRMKSNRDPATNPVPVQIPYLRHSGHNPRGV
jgi:hypothetical protein